MDERIGNMNTYRILQSQYKPIIHSQQVMHEDIVKHLQTIHQNIANVKEQMRVRQEDLGLQSKRRRTISLKENNPLADNFYNKLRQQDPDLDMSFGIYFGHGNIPRIGSKAITISGYDIVIDAQVYHGTPGLWSLITEKKTKDYNREDL